MLRRQTVKTPMSIALCLGVTDAGLTLLAKAVANGGLAEGRGFGLGAPGTRAKLERDGYLQFDGDWLVTAAGEDIVAAARTAGW